MAKESSVNSAARVCEQCGGNFETERRYVDRGDGRFCSTTCAGLAKRRRVQKICQVCGIEFTTHPCRRGKVCSDACGRILSQTALDRECQNCGKMFTKVPSQFVYYKGAGKYCSRECSYQGIVAENRDKPIKDRYGRTGRKADKDWQKAVRERDNYTCRRCGKQDPHIHTHHINPRSRRPDLKHDVDNGMCLCNSCHTHVHHYIIEATEQGFLSTEKYEFRDRI